MKNFNVVVVDRSSSKTLLERDMTFTSKTALNTWAKKEATRQAKDGRDIDIYAYEIGARK